MKYPLYFLLTFVFLNMASEFNQPLGIVSKTICSEAVDSGHLLQDYEKVLNHFKKIEAATFTGGYKDLKLIVRDTKEEKKLSDLSTQEQNVFLLELAKKQTDLMTILQRAWSNELKEVVNINCKSKVANENKSALKADVENYHAQLLILRKKYAVAYESFAEKTLSEFDKLDKKEIDFTLNQIRYVHNVEKLIERKKE